MPMITKISQGRHRRQFGTGLYTAGDVTKGTVPTPSQLARGVDVDHANLKWWSFSQPEKTAWQQAAYPPYSGRQLYSTVARMLIDGGIDPGTATPIDGFGPLGVIVSNVSASLDPIGIGVGGFVFDFTSSTGNGVLELCAYRAAAGIPGAGGIGAKWLFSLCQPWNGAGGSGYVALWGPGERGPVGYPGYPGVSYGLGDTVQLRFLFGNESGFPDPAQHFTVTVGP